MKILQLFVITALFVAFASPAAAQEAKNDLHRKQSKSLREKLNIADSLRLAMRRAADEGRLLQWGDSLLRTRLDSGKINRRSYNAFRRRLYKYDHTLYKGDSILAGRYGRITFDTLYIRRPEGRWTVKLRGNMSGADIWARGVRDGVQFSSRVQSDYRATMSAAVTYRGLSLGIAINPAKLAGKNKDNEFNLTSYGNKFGFDVTYQTSHTYHGSVTADGSDKVNLSKGMVSQKALNANVYYAFNGRRFSIPAAFSQSYVQRRSAGSVMVGMIFDGQNTEIVKPDAFGGGNARLKVVELALGAGYGYNFVAGRRWLFHLSALPALDVFVKSSVSDGVERLTLSYKFPSIIFSGKAAAVYSWRNKFAGATMVLNFSGTGDEERLHVGRSKWRLRVFYGFRF